MQAYYKSKGEDAPYKSLGAFRRARRAQGERYKDIKSLWWSGKNINNEEVSQNVLTNDRNGGIIEGQNNEYHVLVEEKHSKGNIVQIAKEGGKHHGKYLNFKKKYTVKQLEKSISSFPKTIDEHIDKINHPEKYCNEWGKMEERERDGLLRKWKKDLQRNQEEMEIAISVLKEKEDDIK